MTRFEVVSLCWVAMILVVAGSCGGSDGWDETPWPGSPPESRVEIVVDFTRAGQGRVPVSMRLNGVEDDEFRFFLLGNVGEYEVHDVRFTDARGRPIEHLRRGIAFDLSPFEGNVIHVNYDAQPGGMGRHGAQGGVDDRWALFDGRLYLSPKNKDRLQAARLRFVTPEGWVVASPFRKDGDWYYLDMFGPEDTSRLLEKSCVGAGEFDQVRRSFGRMELRVAIYGGWNQEHKQRLADSTFRIAEYFHDTLGFDLRAPYSVVWAPRFNGQRIFGGSFVNGTCFEHDEYQLRNFELLAHRMGHSMNKYEPAGIAIRDPRDHWFREGWASYIEVTATQATGIAEVEQRPSWDSLYRRYKERRQSNPEWDIPLAEEPSSAGDTEEFIHYRKAPLITKMLANQIQWRSGRTMEEFLRAVWGKYGHFRGRLPFQQELEAFTGVSFEDFWVMSIDQRSVVVPAWDDYLTDQMRTDMERSPAALVGGQPLSGDYLHRLTRSGEFATFLDVRAFLIAEEKRRRELDARGVRLYPQEVRDHLFAIPAEDRYAVALLEASYPLELAAEPTHTVAGPVHLAMNRETEDGRAFAELLEMDRRYLSSVSSGKLSGLELRVRGGTRDGDSGLGFALNSAFALRPLWRSAAGRAEVELLQDGKVAASWTVGGEPEQSAATVDVLDRASRPGIVVVRVQVEGNPTITRGYWQRGTAAVQRLSAADASILDPNDPQEWFVKGLALSIEGRHEEALRALGRSTELAPDDAGKWIKHGQTLADLSRHEEAITAFDEALAIDASYLVASGNKAVSLANLRRREESLEVLDGLMRVHADLPSRFLWKGRVLEALRDIDQALTAYRTYADATPKRVEGWIELGRCLATAKRYEESVEAYDKALSLNPRSKPAAKGRKRVLEVMEGRS